MEADELARRTVRRSDYVSCPQAFIDCRLPGSETKQNYAIIGPGVTQRPDQIVNLREPHGFNVGAAAMPHGVTNNLHLHFTAEVFLNADGDWRFRWGNGGKDGELVSHAGDVVSVPTWIFRGFTNEGPDDGWLFTVLGGDDTGGIVWDPDIIAAAGADGLFLTKDSRLVDTKVGDPQPEPEELIASMSDADLAELIPWSQEQMASRVVSLDDVSWSARPFLCSGLPGGGAAYGPVIGLGTTQDRWQSPPIRGPHGFSVSWLRCEPGEGLLDHTVDEVQVFLVHRGILTVETDGGSQTLGPRDLVSVPAGQSRRVRNDGSEPSYVLVVTRGDRRSIPCWSDEVVTAARAEGRAVDPDGYVGPWSVISMSTLDD